MGLKTVHEDEIKPAQKQGDELAKREMLCSYTRRRTAGSEIKRCRLASNRLYRNLVRGNAKPALLKLTWCQGGAYLVSARAEPTPAPVVVVLAEDARDYIVLSL